MLFIQRILISFCKNQCLQTTEFIFPPNINLTTSDNLEINNRYTALCELFYPRIERLSSSNCGDAFIFEENSIKILIEVYEGKKK